MTTPVGQKVPSIYFHTLNSHISETDKMSTNRDTTNF